MSTRYVLNLAPEIIIAATGDVQPIQLPPSSSIAYSVPRAILQATSRRLSECRHNAGIKYTYVCHTLSHTRYMYARSGTALFIRPTMATSDWLTQTLFSPNHAKAYRKDCFSTYCERAMKSSHELCLTTSICLQVYTLQIWFG